ncbi:glycerophosphodiester phosphodiesterase family protein [Nocardioides sp. Bht2]|uniref:glycerophosphodiester phosphodiesterase family protein n=1 Tax=Nocardioides sp. Bht2 TaxID=3392297 RepID=UPI0039B58047
MQRPITGHPYLDDARGVLAFAHRGGATHPDLVGLENTMRAFRHAVALGYRYLETDVHTTSDGVLLAFHDAHLDRVTEQSGVVAEMLATDLAAVRLGGSEAIPTLAELFENFPDARFNIDLKSAASVDALASFLAERDAYDRVMVGSFSATNLRRFRRLTRGRVATSAHPGEVLLWVLAPTGAIADRLTRRRVSALQIPYRRGRLTVASKWLIRKAHRAGKHVHVWTIDDPREMNALIDAGVDGLMTDRTDILKAVLVARGLWEGTPS